MPEAYGSLLWLERYFGGHSLGDWAAEERKRLDRDDEIKDEKNAWRAYVNALDREYKANGDEKRLVTARKYYERVVDKHYRTEAGKLARKALERLEA